MKRLLLATLVAGCGAATVIDPGCACVVPPAPGPMALPAGRVAIEATDGTALSLGTNPARAPASDASTLGASLGGMTLILDGHETETGGGRRLSIRADWAAGQDLSEPAPLELTLSDETASGMRRAERQNRMGGTLTLSHLAAEGTEAGLRGTFDTELCDMVPATGGGGIVPDPESCVPVSGRFDTPVAVMPGASGGLSVPFRGALVQLGDPSGS